MGYTFIMAKPLRTREIVTYLLKKKPSGKPLYSQRQISRTLGISQTTIHKVNTALDNYRASFNKVPDLTKLDDFELNKTLLLNETTSQGLNDNDFEIILKRLEDSETNVSSLLKELQEQINNSEEFTQQENFADTDFEDNNDAWFFSGIPDESQIKNSEQEYYSNSVLSNLSKDGRNYLSSCNYQTFNLNLHHFCNKKNYSDRFIFKPAEYLEIGVLPFRQRSKSNEQGKKTLKEMGRFLFYVYLPFSREAKVILVDGHKPDFTNKMITALIMFFKSHGLVLAIVGKGRIEEVFNGADLPLMKDFFDYCGLLYSSDKRHSVFEEKEVALIEKIVENLNINRKTDSSVSKNLQDRIEVVCSAHNEKCVNEISYLQKNPLPKSSFMHDLGIGQRQQNCHVKFQNHWYSSKYTHKTVQTALEFSNGEVYFVTKPLTYQVGQAPLSRHNLYEKDEKSKYEIKYSTNEDDLPPTDEEARKYGLWTEEDLLSSIAQTYSIKTSKEDGKLVPDPNNSIIRIVKAYIESKDNKESGKYKQQAFNLVAYLYRVADNRIQFIKTGCEMIVQNNISTWAKSLADLLINNKMPENQVKSETEPEDEPEDDESFDLSDVPI